MNLLHGMHCGTVSAQLLAPPFGVVAAVVDGAEAMANDRFNPFLRRTTVAWRKVHRPRATAL
jgi:hypothetical protein